MQIFLNILLYGFLAYWLITAIISQDYWYAFVVLFVVRRVRSHSSAAWLSRVKGVTGRIPV